MSYKNLEFEVKNGLATLSLNRPNRLNALSPELLEELHEVIANVAHDNDIKALLITGNGRGFCAGADISGPPATTAEELTIQGEGSYNGMTKRFNPIIQNIHEMGKPVIAAVNGVAAGYGVSLALACDVVFAAESASFIQVFVPQLGIIPDGGATWLLPRVTTTARAMGMFLSGDKIRAKQAEEWGMIWKCLPNEEFLEAAHAFATKMANGPTLGIRSLKMAMNQSHENSLQRQLQLEATIQKICCASEDFAEGGRAFAEKRKPKFIGR